MYGLVEDDIEDSYSDVNAIAMSTRKLQEDNTIDDAMPKEETTLSDIWQTSCQSRNSFFHLTVQTSALSP